MHSVTFFQNWPFAPDGLFESIDSCIRQVQMLVAGARQPYHDLLLVCMQAAQQEEALEQSCSRIHTKAFPRQCKISVYASMQMTHMHADSHKFAVQLGCWQHILPSWPRNGRSPQQCRTWTAFRLIRRSSGLKSVLPKPTWTLPALSARYSTFPPLKSLTACSAMIRVTLLVHA